MSQTQDPIIAAWRKSRRSQDQGACVEIANLPHSIAIRDSKDPDGPKVVLNRASFRRLVGEIRSGGHDL
jgi:hypothetical protein